MADRLLPVRMRNQPIGQRGHPRSARRRGPRQGALGLLHASAGEHIYLDIIQANCLLFYVSPDFRNTTAAFQLMRHFIRRSVNSGAASLSVHVSAGIRVRQADRFVFRDTDGHEVDEITDFRRADTIVLEGAGFGLTAGELSEAAFSSVPGAAATVDTRIIYDGTTGALFFDADGSGAGAAVQLAQLEGGLALRADDFLVVL